MVGFLTFAFSLVCIITILLILIQKGKSSLGMGGLGAGNQMLFGGSGGQDFFQKLTWTFGAILMAGSVGLAILRSKSYEKQTQRFSSMVAQRNNSGTANQ